jgi:hypothetical protein
VQIGAGFDLDMPFYWRILFREQDDLSCRAILFFFCDDKYPVRETFGPEVFDLQPSGSFFRVPSYRTLRPTDIVRCGRRYNYFLNVIAFAASNF